MRPHLPFVAAALSLAACVTSPTTHSDQSSRRDPFDFEGSAQRSGAPLRIQAFDHATSDFVTIRPLNAGSTRLARDPDIYGWSAVGVTIADRFWVPPGAGCETGGMALLRVQEQSSTGTWSNLVTFDAGGQECLWDEIGDGVHPVAAGNTCRDGDTIVLFAPPQCTTATTHDTTAAEVRVRVTDGVRAFEATSTGADVTTSTFTRARPLTVMGLVRDPDGGVSRVNLAGSLTVECRATGGTTTAVIQDIIGERRQTTAEGMTVEIGLEVTRSIDVNRALSTTCPEGFAPVRLTGEMAAAGANTTGLEVRSRKVRFTIRP